MIKEMTITGLFGSKDTIKIKFNKTLTIITGDNGCGKTTILNIINSIISKTYQNLFKYDFKAIKIELIEKCMLFNKIDEIIQLEEINFEEKQENTVIQILNKEIIEDYDDIEIFDESYALKSYSSLYFPTYRRSEVELTNVLTNNIFQKSMYTRRLSNLNEFKNTVVGISNNDISEIISKKWGYIKEKESQILNSFISEMFLKLLEVKGSSVRTLDSIDEDEISFKIKEIFERTLSINENTLNKKLDSYVNQIKKAKVADEKLDEILSGAINLSEEEFSNQLDSTMELIDLKRNADYSLIQMLKIIKLYDDKSKRIEDLKSPFKKLENTLNEFMYPKQCEINQGRLDFKNGDKTLQFDDLSAGEKQLVSIFIYVGLALEKNGIVLIDEPEISLHIKWQRNIISRLIRNREDLQFIISTHSPAILSNFRNNISKIGVDQHE